MGLIPTPVLANTGTITYDTQYVSQFGTAGTGNGQFNSANDVILGPDNRFYVADRFNNRVQVFDSTGTFITQIGQPGSNPGQMQQPIGVAFDNSGNLVVTDFGNNRVNVYDGTTYAFIRDFGTSNPHGVLSVGSNVYILDLYNHQVNIYDGSGALVTSSNPADLNFPHEIVRTSNGNLYITEYLQSQVTILDASLNPVGSFGTGILNQPVGISVDAYDNIFVTDSGNNRVVVFDKNGNQLAVFGSDGAGDGQFHGPRGISNGPNGAFYVSEGINFNDMSQLAQRVQELFFSSTETFNASPGAGDQTATTDYAIAKLTGTGSFADDFLGYDDLIVNGTDWTLGGANSFDNSVTLASGQLTVDTGGSLTAPHITVDSGTILDINGTLSTANGLTIPNTATLKGSGTIAADTTIDAGGIIAPGNSIGTLHITGDYTHNAGATYQVEVNDSGLSDQIAVTGNVMLNGGHVDVHAAAGSYGAQTNYTILTATGTITGTFTDVINNLAFLTPSLTYNAHDIQLLLTNNNLTFQNFARTMNEHATATAVNTLVTAPTGDAATVANTFNALTQQDAQKALDQIAPDEIANLYNVRNVAQHDLNRLLQQHLDLNDNPLSAAPAPNMAANMLNNLQSAAGGSPLMSRNSWAQGSAGYFNQDGDGNAAGYSGNWNGFRGGMDKEITPRLTLGLSPGLWSSDLRFKGEDDTARIDYYRIDAYGRYSCGKLNFSGLLGSGIGQQKTERVIDVGGLNRTASGKTNYYDLSSQITGLYAFDLKQGMTLSPSLSLSGGIVHQQGFTETGAGALNLSYDGKTNAYAALQPNIILSRTLPDDRNRVLLTPYIGFGAILQTGNTYQSQSAQFAGSTIPAFTVSSTRQPRTTYQLQLGMTIRPKDNEYFEPYFQIHYNGDFNSASSSHTLIGTMNWRF